MIKPLTSLRFFFALAVFFSHLNFFSDTEPFFQKLHKNVFHEGYLGVSFFFILSGFILSLTYKQKLVTGKVSFKEFWVARVARIYPLHLLTLLIAIPLTVHKIFPHAVPYFLRLFCNTFLLQSFIPDRYYYFSFNGPSWSISDEMFFYLLFPSIIVLLHKRKFLLKLALPLLLVIPTIIYFSPASIAHDFFYINPIFRLADFVIGILLYEVYERNLLGSLFNSTLKATAAEIFCILFFILFFAAHSMIEQKYRYSCYYWAPMLLLIWVFAYQAGYVSKLLSSKFFILLGEISFGFYLIHQLSIRYFVNANAQFHFIKSNYVLSVMIFTATLICSYLTFKFVEGPANKYIKQQYKKRVAASRALKKNPGPAPA